MRIIIVVKKCKICSSYRRCFEKCKFEGGKNEKKK